MKRTIVALLAGLAIGGTVLAPAASTATEITLRQRVKALENNVRHIEAELCQNFNSWECNR